MSHRRAATAGSAPRRTVVLAAMIVSLVLPVFPVTAQSSFEEQALQQARDRIAAVERRLDAARGQASAAADRLAAIQADVAVLEDAVNAAGEAVAKQQAEVDRAADTLDRLERQGTDLQRALEAQVVALFKRGTAMRFDAILGSGDVSSAIQRAEFVHVLSASEQALMERIEASRIQIEAQRTRFAAEQERLLAFKAEQDALLARAIAAREEADAILRSAQADVASLAREQDNLEADAEALRELIVQNAAAPTSGLAPSTEGYIWPICGRVTSEYGWRWGRMHEGLDIDGDTGDIIAAAKAGRIIFAGWQGGYGNLILIDHGDGVVTAYAHQSRFFVDKGDAVVRGQKIGAVGNTGRSTGPHLHFETRVGGNADNPRRFLTRGC